MSKMYTKTPAELLFIEDEYTSYCLNEACAFIRQKIENKEEPHFKKQYTSFADIYKKYDRGGE